MSLASTAHPRRRPRGFALLVVIGAVVFVASLLAVAIASLTLQFDELDRRTQALRQAHLMRAAAERADRLAAETDTWTPPLPSPWRLETTRKPDQEMEVRLFHAQAEREPLRIERFRIEEGHAYPR